MNLLLVEVLANPIEGRDTRADAEALLVSMLPWVRSDQAAPEVDVEQRGEALPGGGSGGWRRRSGVHVRAKERPVRVGLPVLRYALALGRVQERSCSSVLRGPRCSTALQAHQPQPFGPVNVSTRGL